MANNDITGIKFAIFHSPFAIRHSPFAISASSLISAFTSQFLWALSIAAVLSLFATLMMLLSLSGTFYRVILYLPSA
jgi:hypothetical protein